MKKHLIAAAVAAAVVAPAMAQNVEIYGVIDQGYTVLDTDTTVRSTGVTTSEKNTTTGNGGAYSSQRLGFRGSEDLGGGLKAHFQAEYGFADYDGRTLAASGADNAAPLTARSLFLGLSGGFGKVQVGRMDTQADLALLTGDTGGANNFIGRLYTSYGKLNNSRSDRLIEYTTPTMNGFSVAVQYGANSTKTATTTSTSEVGVGISYSAGPLNVRLGYSDEEQKTAGTKDSSPEQLALGVNYNFGPAIGFLVYADGKDSGGTATVNDKTAVEVGARIPFGATTLQVSYFDGENKATSTTKEDISGFQISALYALSKRTTLYAVIGADEAKSTTMTNSKVDRDNMGVGIRHTF